MILNTANGAAVLNLFLLQRNAEGTTIALITHHRGIAAQMPRRVEILDGRIVTDTHTGLSA